MRREPLDLATSILLALSVVFVLVLLAALGNACGARKGLERHDAPTSDALSAAESPASRPNHAPRAAPKES